MNIETKFSVLIGAIAGSELASELADKLFPDDEPNQFIEQTEFDFKRICKAKEKRKRKAIEKTKQRKKS